MCRLITSNAATGITDIVSTLCVFFISMKHVGTRVICTLDLTWFAYSCQDCIPLHHDVI